MFFLLFLSEEVGHQSCPGHEWRHEAIIRERISYREKKTKACGYWYAYHHLKPTPRYGLCGSLVIYLSLQFCHMFPKFHSIHINPSLQNTYLIIGMPSHKYRFKIQSLIFLYPTFLFFFSKSTKSF